MHNGGKMGQNERVSVRQTDRVSAEARRQDAIDSAEKASNSMDKHTMKGAAVLCCLVLLTVLTVCAVGAQVGPSGSMGNALREGGQAIESMAGDAMQGAESAIGDMIGEVTDGDGAFADGTNIPEDSSGVITEPVTTARQTERQTTPATVTGEATGGQEMAENDGAQGGGFVGLLVAAIIAVAVILLIVALMPKKRENR